MDVEMLDGTSSATHQTSRSCATCKKPMPDDAPYKSCAPCLTKKREYQRRFTQRKRERKGITEIVGLQTKAEDDENAKKKRVRQILREVQGPESPAADSTTKSSGGGGEAFVVQTASDLYKAIKAQPKLAHNMNACHSIVSVPSISHQKRTKLVSKDLLSFAGLQFDRHENIFNGKHGRGTYTRIFKCKCQSSQEQEQEPLERRASNLRSWVVSSKSKSSEGPCSGRITIVAEDDNSHPLGITGQKISVIVVH
ncbi:uncharacterized protein BT62DRAFT_994884 [Guyanagaster necrorhizus]|uniref:Uncharacterized protein n=1 Tax=Guyanagaster necrorhizus TaxID=856835 RepID=A0A9P8ARH9_9AGAR|nr:uncharacterized protein BT62DRAFT_994884 [Guyanagaster necrorhizus MCA 3950]KAG7445413.1 hypothetical protein BT62DRAFT_994884 [Guyanagaster necrorhizus MCA 3950]